MNYDVNFVFDCVSRKGAIMRKRGQINVDADIRDPEVLKGNDQLLRLLVSEMEKKTNKVIMSVSEIVVTQKEVQ